MNFGKVLLFGFGDNRRNYNGAACFRRIKKKGKGERKDPVKKEQQLKATIPKILLHELLRLQLKLYLSYAGKEWCP
jgi:hypothetical protein